MEIESCPNCFDLLIEPTGPKSSEILIVGPSPADKDLEEREPFTGWTGKNFRRELAKAGLDYYQCRVVYLWMHKPNKDAGCLEFSMEQVIKESIGKKLILLCGAEVISTFTEYKVSDVCGLWIKSSYFSDNVKIMAMFSPGQLNHGGVGEIRLCLEKFIKEVDKL